ncbi:MAG TPA: cupin domain-containing protein [Solirubrobacteraceae bacterium]|nr:cupin domain-containing protein [Solirubrobacteraceae bacterium]
MADGEDLWFLGTLVRIKLDGRETAGRLSAFEILYPRGAAPPLHSHPQDETICLLEGELTAWIVDPDLLGREGTDPSAWLTSCAQRCTPGAVVYASGGTPHTFRVESDTARVLTLSTPAGIEDFVRALAEPARWPWLQPPADGPRVAPDRLEAVERELGVVRHGPPPPQEG